MKISGHGAFGVLVPAEADNARFENAGYTIVTEGTIDDVTDSGSAGTAEGLPIIVKLVSVDLELVDNDSASFALALGMTENQVISFWLKRGVMSTGEMITNTIVRNVRTSNPQNAARRVVISCEYGVLNRGVAQPSIT